MTGVYSGATQCTQPTKFTANNFIAFTTIFSIFVFFLFNKILILFTRLFLNLVLFFLIISSTQIFRRFCMQKKKLINRLKITQKFLKNYIKFQYFKKNEIKFFHNTNMTIERQRQPNAQQKADTEFQGQGTPSQTQKKKKEIINTLELLKI